MLHAAAKLCLHCLSGPDADGRFELERKNDGFSLQTPMEQFHHLFYEVTGAPTFIGELSHPTKMPTAQWVSWDECKMITNGNPDPPDNLQWKFDKIRLIKY